MNSTQSRASRYESRRRRREEEDEEEEEDRVDEEEDREESNEDDDDSELQDLNELDDMPILDLPAPLPAQSRVNGNSRAPKRRLGSTREVSVQTDAGAQPEMMRRRSRVTRWQECIRQQDRTIRRRNETIRQLAEELRETRSRADALQEELQDMKTEFSIAEVDEEEAIRYEFEETIEDEMADDHREVLELRDHDYCIHVDAPDGGVQEEMNVEDEDVLMLDQQLPQSIEDNQEERTNESNIVAEPNLNVTKDAEVEEDEEENESDEVMDTSSKHGSPGPSGSSEKPSEVPAELIAGAKITIDRANEMARLEKLAHNMTILQLKSVVYSKVKLEEKLRFFEKVHQGNEEVLRMAEDYAVRRMIQKETERVQNKNQPQDQEPVEDADSSAQ